MSSISKIRQQETIKQSGSEDTQGLCWFSPLKKKFLATRINLYQTFPSKTKIN